MFGDLTSLRGGGWAKSTRMLGASGGMVEEAADKKGARRMSEGVGAGGRKDRLGVRHVCRAIGR